MRILVTGDRAYEHRRFLRAVLDGLLASISEDEPCILIEGKCPTGGADQFAEEWAKDNAPRVQHQQFPARWSAPCRPTCQPGHRRPRPDGSDYCPAAGNYRNVEMLEKGQPTIVVAFHDDLDSSRGTRHMVEIATAAEVPVYHVCRCTAKQRSSRSAHHASAPALFDSEEA